MLKTFRSSLWSAITPPAQLFPTLNGQVRTDVAVVGAGILGLSLALHLAETGIRVVLVDQEEPGFGASGRNTGFVVPSFPGSISPFDLVAHLGRENTERLARFVGGSGRFLFDLVRRLNLDCSAEQTGWLQPAHKAAKVRVLEERVSQWRAIGHDVRLLSQSETQKATGCGIYSAALLDPTGGQINPLAYVRELARAAQSAGVSIYTQSPVTGFESCPGGWRLTLPQGAITADEVVFTTNAMVGSLLPEVRRSIFLARPYQLATQPLDGAIRDRILLGRQPVADLHRHVFAYRWSPDNRLVTGGLAMFNGPDTHIRMGEYFKARLHRYLKDLPELETAFTWGGVVSATEHQIPRIWSLGQRVYAPIGCNGRGVAITTHLGARLARFIYGGNTEDLPLDITPPDPKFYRTALAFGPSVWLGWNRTLDWIDDRLAAKLRHNG